MAKTKAPSRKELTNTLAGLVSTAKGLQSEGKTSAGLTDAVSRSQAMIKQTARQGGKAFAGSKEEKAYLASQPPVTSGVGVISSNQGKDIIKKADETMARITPEPVTMTETSTTDTTKQTGNVTQPEKVTQPTTAPDTTKDFVTYINETTGQEQTLRGAAINDLNKKSLESQGYKVATTDISQPQEYKDPEITKLEESISQYDTQIASFLKGLTDTLVSDKELQSEISGLKNTYQQRAEDAKQINEQRVQALTTLGIRTGSRYTGGMGGVIGSIITEEERQGLRRINAIEDDLQTKINEAKKSAQDQNYKVYAQQVSIAEKLKADKATELASLKKLAAEENKKKAEQARTGLIDSIISSFIDQGVTNRSELFTKLTDPTVTGIIGNVTAEEFKKTFDALMPQGTGIIGEYEYYKREATRMGQTPLSFDEYQTRDANRKRPVTQITMGAGNIPQPVVNQIDKLSSSFDSSPIVKNYNEVQNKKLSIDSILASGIKGPADLAIVYEFMKALDPTSVVRETEYATAAGSGNIFAGVAARFNGYFAEGGGFLPEQVKTDFQTLINSKMGVADSQYNNLRNETARKIEMKTKQYDPLTPGTEYLTDYSGATGTQIIQDEAKAEDAIVQWVATSPDNAQKLKDLQAIAPDASLSEIAQELGISL